MTYYDDLIRDEKRVSIFKQAIEEYAYGITYDLGTGSGILASFASAKADKVFAFEINPLVIKRYVDKVIESYDNIEFVEADVTCYDFNEMPDVVICEMLDTALIDEEQVPAINNVHKYVKDSTIFIPKSTYDTIQVGTSNVSHITYEEYGNAKFESLSDEIRYNVVDFSKDVNPHFEKDIEITVTKTGTVNSILVTTYTYVTDDLLTQPTPMLNPPLIIPLEEKDVIVGEKIIISLSYIMGGGLNTIRANTK